MRPRETEVAVWFDLRFDFAAGTNEGGERIRTLARRLMASLSDPGAGMIVGVFIGALG